MRAYQRCIRDFTQGRCLVNDDKDGTSEGTYVGRLQSHRWTFSGYTVEGELREDESTPVSPYDGATTQKEDSCDAYKPGCDWKLAVEPFVKLYILF